METVSVPGGTEETKKGLADVKAGITDGVNPALASMTAKTEEAGKAAEHAEVSHRAMAFALRALPPEAREAGHALILGLANPATLAFIALGLSLAKVLGDWEKLKDAVDTAPNMDGVNALIAAIGEEGMVKALNEGGMAANEFWDKINRLAALQETLKENTDDATEAIKRQTEADDKTLSAKEKAELAELKLQETRGIITKAQYDQRKAELEDRYEGTRGNLKAIEQDRVIEERRKELAGQKSIVTAAPDVITPKQIAAEEAKGEYEGSEAKVAEWKKKVEAAQKWIDEKGLAALSPNFMTSMANLGQGLVGAVAGFKPGQLKEWPQEGPEKYAEVQKVLKLAQGKIDEIEAKLPGQKADSDIKQAALAEAQGKIDAATKRVTELEREVAKLEADRTRDAATRGDTAGSHSRERLAEQLQRLIELSKNPGELAVTASTAAAERARLTDRERRDPRRGLTNAESTEAGEAALGDVNKAVTTAQLFEAHKQTTVEQQRQLMEVASALAGHQVSFKEAVRMMSEAGKDIGLFAQDVLKLAGVMGELATGHSALQTQLRSLVSQVSQIKAQLRDQAAPR